MDLSYQEKSIIGTVCAMLVVGVTYAVLIVDVPRPVSVADVAGLVVGAIVALVVIEIVYHTVISVWDRPDEPDERDRLVAARAGRNAYWVGSVGLVTVIVMVCLGSLTGNGVLATPFAVAHAALCALVAGELTNFVSRLVYYRMGV